MPHMNRSRSLAAVLSLVLLAAVGACSSDDSSGDAAGPSSSATASSGASGGETTSSPTPTPKTLSKESSSKAEKYVKDTFGGSSWLKNLGDVKVEDNQLVANTKLGSSKSAKADAAEICRALSAYEVAKEDGFMGVVVKNKDGKTLVERKSLAKGC
jgi:hypothetical protein